jgi:hypothetical protein
MGISCCSIDQCTCTSMSIYANKYTSIHDPSIHYTNQPPQPTCNIPPIPPSFSSPMPPLFSSSIHNAHHFLPHLISPTQNNNTQAAPKTRSSTLISKTTPPSSPPLKRQEKLPAPALPLRVFHTSILQSRDAVRCGCDCGLGLSERKHYPRAGVITSVLIESKGQKKDG